MTYTNVVDEPSTQQRLLTVQAWDADSASQPLTLPLVILLINDYCPDVTANMTSVVFMEGSLTSIAIGQLVSFDITDMDAPPHNDIDSLNITLNGRRDGAREYLSVVPPQGISVTGFESLSTEVLTLTGRESMGTYLAALGTLMYTNQAEEPTVGLRNIVLQPYQEGTDNCVPLTVDVDLIPVNDNPPLLTVSNGSVVYREGSGPQSVLEQSGFSLIDFDSEQFPIMMAEVVLSGIVYDADAEILSYDNTLLPQGVAVTRTAAGWCDPHLVTITLNSHWL